MTDDIIDHFRILFKEDRQLINNANTFFRRFEILSGKTNS